MKLTAEKARKMMLSRPTDEIDCIERQIQSAALSGVAYIQCNISASAVEKLKEANFNVKEMFTPNGATKGYYTVMW